MNLLKNLLSFEEYSNILNESLLGNSQQKVNRIFASKGKIELLPSGEIIDAKDIVDVVMESVGYIASEWTSIYNYAKNATIFYTFNNPSCQTMQVSENLEIYVSANFVHDVLKMDSKYVQAVLMHEIFHVLYDHIKRGKDWLASQGKEVNAQTHMDNNLAADIEVNATLVNKGIVEATELRDVIHGLFLKKKSDDYSTNYIDVISMENILEDDEAMNKLRHMVNYPWPQDSPEYKEQQERQKQDGNQQGQSGDMSNDGNQSDGGNSQDGKGQGESQGGNQGGDSDNQEQSNANSTNKKGGSNKSSGSDSDSAGGSGSDEKDVASASNNGKPSQNRIVIGEYIDSKSNQNDIIKNDPSYTKEERKELEEIRKDTVESNSKQSMERRKQELIDRLSSNDTIKKILHDADVNSKMYSDMWKKILERFLEAKHRIGTKVDGSGNDWKNRHRMAVGMYGVNKPKIDEDDPQDINLYVDVSGSMDEELLSIIAKSIVTFCQKYKYSGMNIVPWASYSGDITKVEPTSKKGIDAVTKEIISAIQIGSSKCGGGTSSSAASDSIVKVCVENLMDIKKKRKDDAHIIITDGEIYGLDSFENDLYNGVLQETKKPDIAKKCLKNTIWIIYSDRFSDGFKENINNSIKYGTKLFIITDAVKKQNR